MDGLVAQMTHVAAGTRGLEMESRMCHALATLENSPLILHGTVTQSIVSVVNQAMVLLLLLPVLIINAMIINAVSTMAT